MQVTGLRCFLLLAMSSAIVTCAPPGHNQETHGKLMTRLQLRSHDDIMTWVRTHLKTSEEESKNLADIILDILHLLGVTDDDITNFLNSIVNGVEEILSQLPPEELMAVEMAAGDILGMLQTGNFDLERFEVDLNVIYTYMWPYVNEDLKPYIEFIVELILWIIFQRTGKVVRPPLVRL